MARTRRFQFHLGPFRAVFLALLLIACASGTAIAAKRAERLYLLAGTLTPNSPQRFPARLYAVGSQHRLELIREIVPAEDGLFDVRDDGGNGIYFAYPNIDPTSVCIIHKRQPELRDNVTFNPKAYGVYSPAFGLAWGEEGESYVLFPLMTRSGPTTVSTTLVGVRSVTLAHHSRMSKNDWSVYHHFLYEGFAGFPVPGNQPLGKIVGNHLVIPDGAPFNGSTQIDISPVPRSLPEGVKKHDFIVFATP